MSYDRKAIKLLFQRPLEPAFTPRDYGKAMFELPKSFLTSKYSKLAPKIQSRYEKNVQFKIPIADIEKPNLDFISKSSMVGSFNLFNPNHKRMAARLIEMLMKAKYIKTFIALALFMKDRVNAFMFQYAYGVSVLHRKDTSHIRVPPVVQQFPSNFIEPRTLRQSRNEATLEPDSTEREPLETPLNYTASDREEEQRVAYFREDIGVNLHHWHWHLVYPSEGLIEIVAKDRRGELFWYMHHQVLARYNVERFCNLLGAVKPFSNLREAIKEGYFPKLINSVTNRTYPSRMPGLTMQDINRNGLYIEITDLEGWTIRIHDAIDLGYITDAKGNRVNLDETRGIDILYNLIESSALSLNRQFYGDLHNFGHLFLSAIHDPDARFLESTGVMGDFSTSMRDPIFYRWHLFIDNLGNKHKGLMPPYPQAQLENQGVVVNRLYVKARTKVSQPNVLYTFWEKSDIDLGSGMDFAGPSANSLVRFTHLQHDPFDYVIFIINEDSTPRRGTCRIFIIPKEDDRKTELSLNEQRIWAIELDKFVVALKPGQNRFKRCSKASTVTIPFKKTFRRIDVQPTDSEEIEESQFCGCGWPEHMLIPKGTPEGKMFDLFVMVSNYADDKVIQTNDVPDKCDDAASFCGLKDKLYPDKRSMGFPFDRNLPAPTLVGLIEGFPNMRAQDVKIIFKNTLKMSKHNEGNQTFTGLYIDD